MSLAWILTDDQDVEQRDLDNFPDLLLHREKAYSRFLLTRDGSDTATIYATTVPRLVDLPVFVKAIWGRDAAGTYNAFHADGSKVMPEDFVIEPPF